MPFRNWRYRNIRRGGCQLYTNGCGCITTLFCTNVALLKQEAQFAAPSRAHPSRRDSSPCAALLRGQPSLQSWSGHRQDPAHASPSASTVPGTLAPRTPLRGHSRGEDGPCIYKATLSSVCLESLLGPPGPSLRANTRPVQPRLYPQPIRSQWDHSCPENPVHPQVVPLAVARSGTAVHSQPLSLQHSHCSTSVRSAALG